MIEDFRGLAVFVSVADAGSLTAAGKRLGLSTSVVSHHLSRLEDKLGVALFFRSTRSMSLTPEGQAALDPARRMVAAGEEALGLIGAGSDEPVGALRISMPAFGDRTPVHQKLWEFARRHPLVTFSVHSSDKPVDLIRDGFDLAIRLGTLADSGLKSRRIGDFGRLLVASPAYLAERGPIARVEDLAECAFISVSMISDAFTLQREGTEITVEPSRLRVEVNSIASAASAVRAGLGMRALPRVEVEDDIATGRLVHVLPDWRLPDLGVYAVWPDSGPQKILTRRLIDTFMSRDPI